MTFDGTGGDAGGEPGVMPVPLSQSLPGTRHAAFRRAARTEDLPPGSMVRVSDGDLDVLLAHTSEGLVATEDRCPHMSAPLSLGRLDGCVVDCPLHSARFDLCTGEPVVYPTTGGLGADGTYHPTWTPSGSPPRPEPADIKARARALTRIRRMRYLPLRIRQGWIEVAFPP